MSIYSSADVFPYRGALYWTTLSGMKLRKSVYVRRREQSSTVITVTVKRRKSATLPSGDMVLSPLLSSGTVECCNFIHPLSLLYE